ncbi:MAG TPA: IclR family transcriptional regulator [Myxococcota bacterium]|nr:IclR family transcriptional regulator [Myxococcota bacterium]
MPRSGGSSKPKSDYAIQTVTNALRMLEVFHTETEMGVSDLARRLGLHKNNAFRLLATLELAGYIQQTPETELYHLGPRCLELAHAFARSHTLMRQARPILEELARDCGETAHLGVLSRGDRGDEVVHLDGVQPAQLVLTGSRVGERLPAHCTALGKVLLAHAPGYGAPSATAISPVMAKARPFCPVCAARTQMKKPAAAKTGKASA